MKTDGIDTLPREVTYWMNGARKTMLDAEAEGFVFVEGYPNRSFRNQAEDFMGPRGLYDHAGFEPVYVTEQKLVMRKQLR